MFDRLKKIVHNNSKDSNKQQPLTPTESTGTHGNGLRTCVYYSDWSIYERKHFPEQIPLDLVTNIFYAFFNIDPNSGEVKLSDPWADTDIEFQSPYDSNKKINGLLARFYEIKQHSRHVKVSMSIGGWSYSDNFKKGTDSEAKLSKFVDSALKSMIEYGFDGIDLDWEYPENRIEAAQYLQIMKKLREGMRNLETEHGLSKDSFLLTIASPAFAEKLDIFNVEEMDKFLSFWNLMTYDFAGSWSDKTGYHCNLYKKSQDELCADDSIKYFLSKGISSSKLVLGMANYGRSFTNTDGFGKPFQGVGPGSDGEQGFWFYNKLPMSGSNEEYDSKAVIGFNYNKDTKTFVSYDTVDSVSTKAQYVIDNKLGGGMWWESCGDKYDDPDRSLINSFVKKIGNDQLDSSSNVIDCYDSSEYLKKNFGDI
ncbi:Chitinase 1 [Wickerhamomyces ciferrii]|uniref:chitinase n=1 Tax=Wickerhamomyces ciferrii (strain ATCC 14091 / BCRC 22168 / CBS 111 / JCM 3599 / NBRC 0793 / NRRL Y-1031 F-60-10) TaxID=1206466 RepID=K0KNL4_WICCF|nr:Chitinase 1 [Wickerhamomyces ciferrii]CCH46845.1 Chitinase 1 [Wickerhamomyces ciferrii]